mgnify:FL=1
MAATMAAIMEITENIMRRMHEPSTKLHNALYFMSGMMVVILALVIVAGVKTKAENAGFHIADDTENSYEQQVAGQTDTTHDSGQEKWQEGVVAYQGKEYLYNTDIKTYLMMGVDIDGPEQRLYPRRAVRCTVSSCCKQQNRAAAGHFHQSKYDGRYRIV